MKIKSWNLVMVLVLGLISSLQWPLSGSIKTAASQFRLTSNLSTAGELDPTFGQGGLVTANMYRNSYGTSVALQPDGKIVVAGDVLVSTNSPQFDFGLTRYNTDGSLDTTFGSNGIVVTDFDNTTDYGYGVAIQTDGKIVLAGSSTTGYNGYYYALVRYNTDGSLDTTFGTGGKVSTDLGGGMCYGIVLQTDDKIVVTGQASDGAYNPAYGIGLVRFNSDGSLDNTFGDNGVV
ncbi:MAG: delta-60 repeat domain-containing protein, partial [Chloroflexi bacterium]|nr:delta-60 repeat domain-containing protein [Chloroflexota bacterium]